MGFNEAQEKAISHNKGPMMVLAGPGSGKTLVITHRTKHLIEEYGVNPSNILVITYTKAAAKEMQGRFNKLIGNAYPVTFGTFHAVFFKILRIAYNLSGANILREESKYEILKEIIADIDLEIDDIQEFISGIISEISVVKGDMINLNNYYSKNCSEDNFKKIYNQYEKKLQALGLIDFDDMLVKCYELLKERQDILRIWQNKYEYILIDEFQDINKIQYEIVKLLSKPADNLFIVGDDDQSVYRFRGAKPEIMLNFTKDYKNAVTVLLDINYRSTGKIVTSSLNIINNNKNRFSKAIKTNDKDGDKIIIKEFADENTQIKTVVNEILEYVKNGGNYNDIAFLFRTNIGPRTLVGKFMEYNIPFKIKDSLPNIFDHWICKDLLAYIRLSKEEKTRNDFYRVMNKPVRYFNRGCVSEDIINFNNIRLFYENKKWMLDRIEKLEYDLTFISNMPPYAAINYIRKAIGYDEYILEYAKFRRINEKELYEVLDEIMDLVKDFSTIKQWQDYIIEYSLKLKSKLKEQNQNMDGIEIATMHSSKGLEYKKVYIIDANEGITPHNKAILIEDLEEERRLFYVAVTRAKEYLNIYYVKEKHNKPLSASRFIGELMYDINTIKPGVKINHKKYGEGIIKKTENGKISIYFVQLKKTLTFNMEFVISNRIIELI